MWVFDKIRESMDNIPLELSQYMGRSNEDVSLLSKTSLSQNLHYNILTPDKIPQFCLPPRLCKRNPLPDSEKTLSYLHSQIPAPKMSPSSNTTHSKMKNAREKKGEGAVAWKASRKPLPFSAEGYGLAGLYESPNTRRKESLFHAKSPGYMFDRTISTAAPRMAKKTALPKKTFSGFLPLLQFKSLSETGSSESETQSSSESSPLTSPYSGKSSHYIPSNSRRLKGAVSCPSLAYKELRGRQMKVGLGLTSSRSPPRLQTNSFTLAPPILFPLDVLQCQERLQREHVLPLQGRGRVRLSAERTTFSKNAPSSLSTVRIRVVSVEGLWYDTDRQTLNCAVSLCLTPGKQQQQQSATIRNCRTPVFNEDFFFIELSHQDLQELQLRLKVVDKSAAGPLRRETVIGIITEPLSQLLR